MLPRGALLGREAGRSWRDGYSYDYSGLPKRFTGSRKRRRCIDAQVFLRRTAVTLLTLRATAVLDC